VGVDYISASALEKYAYCPLSWWLSRESKVDDEDLKRGTIAHRKIGRGLATIQTEEQASGVFEVGVLGFAVGATVLSIMGIILLHGGWLFSKVLSTLLLVLSLIWLLASSALLLIAERVITERERLTNERVILLFAMIATILAAYAVSSILRPDTLLSKTLEVLSLLWLISASLFLYASMRGLRHARLMRMKYTVPEGKIEYVDELKGGEEMLHSEKYGLRGRPDYIITDDNGEHIPVEIKSGRVPKGPLFSHIIQITAYAMLVEEKYGKAPSYGILKYGDVEHHIEYTPEMKKLVVEKLMEMRNVMEKGEAHRNHNRIGKCQHCSRRSICPESLA